ncbi:unnamed protein product [Rotaria sp. Silwood2]|nr:unnamed protein product [Rotaria sp. Silwood2]CAF4150661.1 unnamed protein product [Rotaria sp. Silwood2]
MGNTGFWIDSIIEKRQILPTHADFYNNSELRTQLCPLIWNSEKQTNKLICGGFIKSHLTAKFFELLIEKNFPGYGDISDQLRNTILVSLVEAGANTEEILVFEQLMDDDFISILKHYNLFFGESKQYAIIQTGTDSEEEKKFGDFTYDVVLTLDDLGKALGVTTSWMVELDDLIQSKVEEKLGLHTYQGSNKPRPFRLWIVFNARGQRFQVVKGITAEILRELITVKANAPSQACALARAHLQNAFSMCNPDGTDPRPIDFDRFQGAFTPEFYPRRFSLKDSIYSQRLDVLAALLVHVLRRYQCCLPPVRYCELSVGLRDICSPWVFDVLCSFPAYDPIANEEPLLQSNFFAMIVQEGCFPHLRSACLSTKHKFPCVPNVTYKFLAGFNRQSVKAHRLANQIEAISLLNDSPNVAIHYMLQEIVQSEKDQTQEEQDKSLPENNQVCKF